MLRINASVSELFDKVSILEIKKSEIKTETQLVNIFNEFQALEPDLRIYLESKNGTELYSKIYACNLQIWKQMDKLFDLHSKKILNNDYAEICYKVTELNKLRSYIKREIDTVFKSDIQEEKSYFGEIS